MASPVLGSAVIGGQVHVDVFHEIENVIGTIYGDHILGSSIANQIDGHSGHDTVLAGDGVDLVWGNLGNDELHGDGGGDHLYGGHGLDVVEGDSGSDDIGGGDGADVLYGGTGLDTVDGDDGADYIWGGGSNDRLYGGDGDDTLFGDEQSDSLFGDAGDDVLTGGSSGDRFVLQSGAIGDDRVTDFSGTDKVDLVGVSVLAGLGTSVVAVGTMAGFSAIVHGTLTADNGHLWEAGDFV